MAKLLKASKTGLMAKANHTPHSGQVDIHASKARHKCVACGRRFGKSTVGGYELYCEACVTRYMLGHLHDTDKRREFWIVGPEYTDAEKEFRVVYNALSKRNAPFDKPGTYNDPHSGDMQISMYQGKLWIIGKSAKHPERLVGEGLNGVVMAEAAKQRESTWVKFIRPALADFQGWSLFMSTPEGKNWFYHLWMRGQSKNEESWASWRRPAWLNPIVYTQPTDDKVVQTLKEMKRRQQLVDARTAVAMGVDPEVYELLRDLTYETFGQEIEALFTEFAGRVFKEFDEEVHVTDLEFQPGWETVAAVDHGTTNPFVWLLIQIHPLDGRTHVLREIHQPGLDIEEAVQLIIERQMCPSNLKVFYPDPANPGDNKYMSKKLNIRAMGGTGGLLETRLRIIRSALTVRNQHLEYGDPERNPMLLIDRSCVETIREMNDYRYPKTVEEARLMASNAPEHPLKKDDHSPEALGRYFVARWGRSSNLRGSRVRTPDWRAGTEPARRGQRDPGKALPAWATR